MCGQSLLCWQHPDAVAHTLIRQMGHSMWSPLRANPSVGFWGTDITSWTGKPCSLRCIVCSNPHPMAQASRYDIKMEA